MSAWRRVSKRATCPVCAKPDWCSVATDGAVVCCMRVESPRQLHNGGFLHRLADGNGSRPECVSHFERPRMNRTPSPDFRRLSEQYERGGSDPDVAQLASQLGVSAESLRRLHIGYDGHGWTFPMRDATGRILGIRRRLPNGRKLAVRGSREGLFIPDPLGVEPEGAELFVCEGPTDTAAILTLGLTAIGRPSCTGGIAYVVTRARGRDVVIVGDQDMNGSGQRGALRLARELQPICPLVQIIMPPPGINDVRAWVCAGAIRSDIESTRQNGPIVRFAEPTRRAKGNMYCETG